MQIADLASLLSNFNLRLFQGLILLPNGRNIHKLASLLTYSQIMCAALIYDEGHMVLHRVPLVSCLSLVQPSLLSPQVTSSTHLFCLRG